MKNQSSASTEDSEENQNSSNEVNNCDNCGIVLRDSLQEWYTCTECPFEQWLWRCYEKNYQIENHHVNWKLYAVSNIILQFC